MSSVLIFIKPDNDHDNPKLDWSKFKAGDVIDIHKMDKWDWGSAIQGPKALGLWVVVIVPDAPVAALAHLMESGPMLLVAVGPQNPAEVPHQKRLWRIDTTALTNVMTLPDFLAAASRKPVMIDPAVIG